MLFRVPFHMLQDPGNVFFLFAKIVKIYNPNTHISELTNLITFLNNLIAKWKLLRYSIQNSLQNHLIYDDLIFATISFCNLLMVRGSFNKTNFLDFISIRTFNISEELESLNSTRIH